MTTERAPKTTTREPWAGRGFRPEEGLLADLVEVLDGRKVRLFYLFALGESASGRARIATMRMAILKAGRGMDKARLDAVNAAGLRLCSPEEREELARMDMERLRDGKP